MSKENVVGVALVKRLCPVCLKEEDAEIILNQILVPEEAKKVESIHGKVIGYSDKICNECKEKIGEGVYFVGINPNKTEDTLNPYRTGQIIGLSIDATRRILKEPEVAIKKQCCFVPEELILHLLELIETNEEK